MRIKKYWVVCFVWGFLSQLGLESQNIPITPDIKSASLTYFWDSNQNIEFENLTKVEFKNTDQSDFNWGKQNGSYWFRLAIEVTKSGTFVFNIPTIHIDKVELYQEKEGFWYFEGRSGNKVPLYQKSIADPYSAIHMPLSRGEHILYIKAFFGYEALFPLEINSLKEYEYNKSSRFFVSSFYYGIVIMILLINGALYYLFRDKSYVAYMFFLFTISMSLFYDDGFASYFFPSFIHAYDSIEIGLHWINALTASWFTFSYLNISFSSKMGLRWFLPLLLIDGILYFLGEWFHNFYLYKVAGMVTYILFFSCWFLALYMSKSRKYARALAVAYVVVLFMSLGHYVLRVLGWQFVKISPNVIKLGSFIEMVMLTFAILYKFRVIQTENHAMKGQILSYIDDLKKAHSQIKNNTEFVLNQMAEEHGLSHREKEVLAAISQHYSNSEISEKLFISVSTVKYHIGNIFDKIGVRSRNEILKIVAK